MPSAAAREPSRGGRCRRAATRPAAIVPRGSRARPLGDRGHRRLAPGARRHSDRSVVEPQHQKIFLHPAGRQPVARAGARPTLMSKLPSALRMISWLVKPCRCAELATSRPSGSYRVRVQNRACGVTPLSRTSQRPSSGWPASSVQRRTRPRRPIRSAIRRCGRRSRAHRGRSPACRSSAIRSRRRS